MATYIHHGPPGSYKSFTVVQRHAIPALQAGRTVVTNVRGFDSLDLIKENFFDIKFPESARIIWVDTKLQEGRDLMARWFHWVPFGSFVMIDEAQRIYPDRSDFKLISLDSFPFDIEVDELPEPRPEDVLTAFDMQRHFNWNIYLSTPNIAKIKLEIRESSEWAFRHWDISNLLPWLKNTWYEQKHDPETSGKSPSHFHGVPKRYKADERVFKCYKSTATGEHNEVENKSVFSDTKLRNRLFIVVLSLFLSSYLLFSKLSNADDSKSVDKSPGSSVPISPSKNTDSNRFVSVAHASGSGGYSLFSDLVGIVQHELKTDRLIFAQRIGSDYRRVSITDLRNAHVDYIIVSLCSVMVNGKLLRCESEFNERCTGFVTTPEWHKKTGCIFEQPRTASGVASSEAAAVRVAQQ